MHMNRILPIMVIGLVLLASSASCTASPATTLATSVPATASASQATTITAGNAISIEEFTFKPATLTIKAGTTVTWTNNDTAGHDVKSDSFQSPTMAKGQTFSFTFNNTGTFNYICGIHPNMKGTIKVE
jgi:plastocyanin